MDNETQASSSSSADLLASLQAENAQLRMEMQAQLASQQETIAQLREEIQLLLRRLYGNSTERGKTIETQLSFDDLVKAEKALQKELDDARKLAAAFEKTSDEKPSGDDPAKKRKPSGRRNLAQSSLPRIEVEIDDPRFEGIYPRSGFDVSYQLYLKRSSYAVLVKKTAKYTVTNTQGTSELSAAQPETLFERGLLHTSTIADIITRKFSRGEPLARQEQQFTSADSSIDRGTMSRYVEQAGNAFGATVVNAMWQDALKNAGVISTDATGAAIQPEGSNQAKQSCRKGHFFTTVVDDSAVLFHFVAEHTKQAVKTLLGDFRGFLQADAHHVYNVLEKPPRFCNDDQDEPRVTLVGCWAHCRRYFFEAALCRHEIGVQGLMRIAGIYVVDRAIMKLPRSKRTQARQERVLPLMNAFFAWAKQLQPNAPRSRAARALGYALNQEGELRAVLLNPDVPLDNTRAERALRKIVVGRKNWMFYGSDCHAEAAAAIFSLIATCRLHRIDPQQYLDELMRVSPYWPKDRYLELAPQHWSATRARLHQAELDKLISHITVPPPLS